MDHRADQTVFANLLDALLQPGCAVCRLVLVSLERYFDHLTFEFVNDLTIRDRLRSSWGFCARHGEMLLEKRDALGTAIIYKDVLEEVSRKLSNIPKKEDSGGGFWSCLLKKKEPAESPSGRTGECPACLLGRETEEMYLALLLERFSDGELKRQFRDSRGLCVPHFEQAAEIAGGAAGVELRREQIRIWERLVLELSEFIRKSDHQFRNEPMGEERDSWRRAVGVVSGTWREDPGENRKP